MKNIIILFSMALAFLFVLNGCASNPEKTKAEVTTNNKESTSFETKESDTVIPSDEEFLDSLEATFHYFKTYKYSEDQEDIDSFFVRVTDSSKEWFESMEEATRYEDSTDLVNRPFYEILTITGVRLMYRNNVITDIDTAQILNVITGKYGILKRAFGINSLGPMWIHKKDGELYGYRGMASSPKVPLYYFYWSNEESRWQLDLAAMLPIISRGLETVGIKKKWSPAKTALYILEQVLDYEVNSSLLKP